ncbi:hypothetical protein BIY29_05380 [Brenneria alni]|uniref:Uncharacterized protein n=1 Tax=Brenneria alni TaxID=71656 RepID=A0A421DR66_9GAMM|nr:hypothetical protein BIY29_05380 [Brenneria alni]
MEQQQKNADRAYDFERETFDYRKESDTKDRETQAERYRVGDGQWQTEFELNKRNSDRTYAMQAEGVKLRREELAYQRSEQKRQQRLKDEMPTIKMFYDQLEKTGNIDPDLYKLISTDNSLHPKRFFGEKAIKNVMEINRVMPAVINGDMDYNDPAAISAVNEVLSPHIQRGIGDKDPATGLTIKGKELAHIGLTEDGQRVIPTLKVTYSDGSTALKPMTRYGSSDPQDTIAPIPVTRLMDEVRGYGQMVVQLNDGNRAQFINNMVNPPDKATVREEAKGLRKDLLDVEKERYKAIAKDPDNAVTINAQYDQLLDQVKQAHGQQPEDRTTPVLQQWAAGDPGKIAYAKQLAAAAASTPGYNLSKEHLDAKYAEAQKRDTQAKDADTAQKLRERAQSRQPVAPPYYTGQ